MMTHTPHNLAPIDGNLVIYIRGEARERLRLKVDILHAEYVELILSSEKN